MEFRYDKAQSPWYAECVFDSLDDFRSWFGSLNIQRLLCYLDHMVYRGVGKANTYKLIPNAFRDNERGLPSIVKYLPNNLGQVLSASNPPINHYIAQAELSILQTLYNEANMQGLRVPRISLFQNSSTQQFHHEYLNDLSEWPEESVVELMALAQHYGLSTRMLDWTYDLNVAIYFALRDVIKRKVEKLKDYECKIKAETIDNSEIEEPYAIWAIDLKFLESLSNGENGIPCPVQFFVPSYSDNKNIAAQKGILAYQRDADFVNQGKQRFSVKTMDALLLDYFNTVNRNSIRIDNEAPKVFKLIFNSQDPVSEFEFIQKLGYNASRLFPGYRGIADKIDEDDWIRIVRSKSQDGYAK